MRGKYLRLAALAPLGVILSSTGAAAPGRSAPLDIPFDFSRSAIALDVTINGAAFHMLLDTGVDPSVIDLASAQAAHLKVDHGDKGEASGFGEGKGAAVFPTAIDGLSLQGRAFHRFDALAADLGGLSRGYGRKLDGVLGYSFLSDKIVLIDYPARRLTIADTPQQLGAKVRGCRKHWSTPMKTVDSFPVIPQFRFGAASAPVTLDTGANGGIGLYQSAFELPGLRAALVEQGSVTHSGARGDAKAKSYALNVPVGFGPFTLPAGQVVTQHSQPGSRKERVANVGNALFAAMKLRVLLDYRGHRMAFYGDCR